MGDLCDYVGRNDWRFDHRGIATWVDEDDIAESQRRRIVSKLQFIKKKILGALMGNHELALQVEFEQAVHKRVVQELETKDLGYMALVRFQFVRRTPRNGETGNRKSGQYATFDVALHHGWGGGSSDGADVAKLDILLRDYSVDWAIAGHTHRYWASKSVRHFLDQRGNLGTRITMKARSGTFLKTVKQGRMSYSERGAMRPIMTGALCVTVSPHLNDFEVNI